jgi:hypothetical protein
MNLDFINDIPDALEKYPMLMTSVNQGVQIVSGELIIQDLTGKVWDRYQIEIHPSERYPLRFPLLFETGNRIPKIVDWHIYSDSGSCCVDIQPSEIIHCRNGLRLPDYIERFAIPYFANTTHRIREGYYKYGEYSHGAIGLLEYYMPLLRVSKPVQCLNLLKQVITGAAESKSIFHPCFCGSGKKLTNCHRQAVEQIKMIGVDEVKNHTAMIWEFLQKVKAPRL